jgi:hypothetical protein
VDATTRAFPGRGTMKALDMGGWLGGSFPF